MDLSNPRAGTVCWMKRGFISLTVLLFTIGSGRAQAPVMEEQMVYRLRLFDGKGYVRSFCPQTEESIYTIAGSDNVLLPTMTLVYYWPITRRYKAGFKTLSEPVQGTLEIIEDGKIIQKLKPQTYTFSYEKGWYAGTSEAVLGEEAGKRHAEYQRVVKSYTDQLKSYYDKKREYRRQMEEFYAKAGEGAKSGTTSQQEGGIPVPKEPPFPEAPQFFVQEPAKAYIVHLPVGRYRIRLRAPEGTIIEGSEKNLVSFTHRRSGRVGYEVISAKRWTMPETSSDPSEILYLEGKKTLYFRSYIQTEYNHLYYSKLLDPQNEGYPELWRWVNIKQIEKGTLQLVRDGQIVASIQEKPYYVEQVPGPELGYRIAEYMKENFPDRGPSLVGYKVEFEPEKGGRQIQVVDAAGRVIPGSTRELRGVELGKPWNFYLASVVLPLAVGVSVLLWRRWKLK